MATVINNPVMIHQLLHYGMTPKEYRAIDGDNTPRPAPMDFDYSKLVAYLADFVKPPPPPADG